MEKLFESVFMSYDTGKVQFLNSNYDSISRNKDTLMTKNGAKLQYLLNSIVSP